VIQINNVVKSFKDQQSTVHAVRGVSLTINDGEIFGIIGYSGAGKSTLIRTLNQLERHDSGAVIIDGEDLGKLSVQRLRQRRMKIGMIFQHFNLLWSRTVEQNISLPLEIAGVKLIERQQRVSELIQLVGLQGKEKAYPSQLSGGQKQRVGIARALANHPDVLLCDEATSALDPETTEQILTLLEQINQQFGITIVMISHQMEVVKRICHRVAVMSDGVVVESGSVQQLFEHPQHPVTKRFVQTLDGMDFELIQQELKNIYRDGYLLRLYFAPAIADKPILQEVMINCAVKVSIVNARILHSYEGPTGVMYVHIDEAQEDAYRKLVQDLLDFGVKVEVIG